MTKKELNKLISSDLYRYYGEVNKITFLRVFKNSMEFRFLFFLRKYAFWKSKNYFIAFIYQLPYKHYTYKLGIQIPYTVKIEKGFKITHFGNIVINSKVEIGKNVNISHGVTIGKTIGGKRPGTPIIGNNVYIAPGAKIIGGIKIGDGVSIGANAVVTTDIPNNSIVAGIPAKVISNENCTKYLQNTII